MDRKTFDTLPGPYRPRILAIDDDESILQLVRDILSTEYDVVTTADASTGLERLQTEDIDLLILDLGMPGVSGVDAVKLVREQVAQKDLPILVVSAYNDLRHLVDGLQVQGVLPKPFSLADLEECVEELLRPSPRPGQAFAAAMSE